MSWIDWTIAALAVMAVSFAAAVAYGRRLQELDKARLRDAYTPREVVCRPADVPQQVAADVVAAAKRRGVTGGEW